MGKIVNTEEKVVSKSGIDNHPNEAYLDDRCAQKIKIKEKGYVALFSTVP